LKEGIDRAKQAAAEADVLVVVLDGSCANWSADMDEIITWSSKTSLVLLNKNDKGIKVSDNRDTVGHRSNEKLLSVSAQNGTGLSLFEARLEEIIQSLNRSSSSVILTRVRHQQAVRQALEHLQASLNLSAANEIELVAEEFRSATSALSRILGHFDIEDVLEHIFSSSALVNKKDTEFHSPLASGDD